MSKNTKLIDCDKGRELGCKSFCCRLLIRLKEHERNEIDPDTNRIKGYVDKNVNGICIHQDDETGLCKNWENRPEVCREYDCNHDKLLQIVFRSKYESIGHWMKESVTVAIDDEQKHFVPYL